MLGELIGEAARRFGASPAFVAAEGWVGLVRDLDRLSDEVAAGLRRRGVRQGDVVALVLPPIPEYLVAYLAAAKVGAITAGVNARLSRAGARRRARARRPAPGARHGRSRAGRRRRGRRGACRRSAPTTCSRELRTPGEAGDAAVVARRPRPAGRDHLHVGHDRAPRRARCSATASCAAITAIDVGDRWGRRRALARRHVARAPRSMTKLAGNLRQGGATFLIHRWRADDALRLTAEHGMTGIGGIPTQVALMLRDPDFERYDLSALRAHRDRRRAGHARARARGAQPLRCPARGALLVHRGGHRPRHRVRRPRGGRRGERRPAARGRRAGAARRRRRAGPDRRGRRGLPAVARGDERLLARPGGDRGRVHAPTASCAPATSAGSTSRAGCGWPGAARRCTCAAATTCTRWRSRRCSPSTPRVAAVVVVPRPDDGDGRGRRRGRRAPHRRRSAARARGAARVRVGPPRRVQAARGLCVVDVLPLTAMEKVDRRALQHAFCRRKPPSRRLTRKKARASVHPHVA